MGSVEGAWKIAAALCSRGREIEVLTIVSSSRHIGGAINYVAVADVLEVKSQMQEKAERPDLQATVITKIMVEMVDSEE
eukprot:747901-Hanusia_phi.AAC.1